MKKWFNGLLAIALAVMLSGCAVAKLKTAVVEKVANITENDLRAGFALAEANADLLGPDDQWGSCYLKVADTLARVGATQVEGGLIFTAAMRLHILEKLKAGVAEEIKLACGQVLLDVLIRAVDAAPIPIL